MLTSRFSDDYSYRRPYPTAAARRVEYIPYLGRPEDELRTAFIGAYGDLHDQFQSDDFAAELQDALRHGRGQGVALVDGYLVQAERTFSQPLPSVFQPITAAGAASVVVEQPVAKAKYPRLIGLTRVSRHPRLFNASSNHIAAANALQLDLVVHVTSTQRKKMAQIVGQSFTRGIEPDVTGERLASVAGLFPRWQAAVDNYYMAMLMNGVQHDLAWQRAKTYHDQLLDKRGEMISRTEIMRALNDGRLAGWHDLADKGYMDGSTSVKHWNAVSDACPECLDIEPVVGIDSDFDTDHGSIAMPPAHPHCRCSVTIDMAEPVAIPDEDIEDANGKLSDPELARVLDNLPLAS